MAFQTPEEFEQLPQKVKDVLASLTFTDGPVPLLYKSVEEMQRLRTPPLDIPATIQTLTEEATLCHKELVYLAQIATALLLLGQGYVDEAHDLVLGLSWRGDLPYSYGDSVSLQDSHIQTFACYAHCLVHRAEGTLPSEFNMTGFENSDFWAGHAMRDDPAVVLPLTEIRQAVLALPNVPKNFVQDLADGILEPWDPRVLTKTLKTATDPEFATQAALIELKLVTKSVLRAMGYYVVS